MASLVIDTQTTRVLPDGGSVAYPRPMTAATTDRALMMRYRDGDLAAFDTLYARHKDALYRYLLRLSLDRSTAEDLYQEVWAKIVHARARYQPSAKFSTFLYRVARNCAIDHIRKHARRNHDVPLEGDSFADPVGDSTSQRAEQARMRDRLAKALACLPTEQRDAFLLYEEVGFSVEQIAELTGTNRETAKSRLRYANRKLRKALVPATDNEEG